MTIQYLPKLINLYFSEACDQYIINIQKVENDFNSVTFYIYIYIFFITDIKFQF